MIISYIRTVILYFALITVIRLMGKRQIGEMEPTEFVVTMLIADLASVPMQDPSIPLLSGLIPILTVLAMELILSFLSFRFLKVRRLLCGKPVILMENGKILYESLKKTRVTADELVEHLRENGITDLSTVQYAILETNGRISVLPYPKYAPAGAKDAGVQVNKLELPITVISGGKWIDANLPLTFREKHWFTEELKKQNCRIEDVLLFSITKSGTIYLARRREEKA